MHAHVTRQGNLLCPVCSDHQGRLFRLVAIRADDQGGSRCTFRCAAERCGPDGKRGQVKVWRAAISPADLWNPDYGPPPEQNGAGRFRPFNLPPDFECPRCGPTTGPVPTAPWGDPDGDPNPAPQPLPTTLHVFTNGERCGAAIHPPCGTTLFTVAL